MTNQKLCKRCSSPTERDRRATYCEPCRRAISVDTNRARMRVMRAEASAAWHAQRNARRELCRACNPAKRLLEGAKRRALRLDLPFDLTLADVTIPKLCPVLGIPLFPGKGKFCTNSPTVDRLRPELGYVRGNVVVISFRANNIKQNATAHEISLVADYVARHITATEAAA